MELNYKSPTSIQEASVGNVAGKSGLKRKLTRPLRLLLGKSKAKNDPEGRGVTPGVPAEGLNSYGNHKGTMVTQQSTIQEERSPENQEKTVELEVKQVTPKNPFKTEGWYSVNQREEKAEHSGSRNDPKEQPRKRVWKRIFSSPFDCIRKRKRLSRMSEMEDVDFRNAQLKFECDTELGTSDTLLRGRQQNHQMNNHQGCRTVKRRTPFPVCIRRNITKLLKGPGRQKKAKRQSEQRHTHFGYTPSLGPGLYLGKRIRHFLKRGPKIPSLFYHEQLEGNRECLDEETVVLSNRHADEARQRTPPDIREENLPDGVTEASGSQSLTVNVEVSAIGEADREERQTDTDLEASGNLIIAGGQRESVDPQALAEESDEDGMGADTTKPSGHPKLVIRVLLVKESTVETREGQGDILEGPGLGYLVDDMHISSYESFKGTVGRDEKSVEETIPPSTSTNEDSMQDNLALKDVSFDDLLLCNDDTNRDAENDPVESSELSLQKKDDGYTHGPRVEVLDSRCSDVLLVQTAYCLVQAAMKAALDQLTKELNNKTVRTHADYHEF